MIESNNETLNQSQKELSQNVPEVELRNETFLDAVKLLKQAKEKSLSLAEYQEFNLLHLAIQDLEDSFRDRITSLAKTRYTGLITRLHQFDIIINEGK